MQRCVSSHATQHSCGVGYLIAWALFDETLKLAMDYGMSLRMGKLAAPVQIPKFLSVFRVHGDWAIYANCMASFLEDHAVRKRFDGAVG